MANGSGSGGTSLAPTPTHPHHLSREPSREDVEMAEQLSQLNQVQDSRTSRIASPSQAQQAPTPPPAHAPEIYHSLEDARPMRESEQPEQGSFPATPASLPQPNLGSGNALLTGQVCRWVSTPVFLPADTRCLARALTSHANRCQAIAERPKPLCGGDRPLEKPFAMPVVCTRRRETNHAQLTSSATPQASPFSLSIQAQYQAKDMTGVLHQEVLAHRRGQQPTSRQITKPPEPALEAVDVMAWEVSKAAADVPLSTIVFPRRLSSR